ncbi:MAG: MFS transporter [Clostridia bacterium]|nr:MFS transporter [Clostridia bacterium]
MPDDIRKTDHELEQVNSKLRQLVDVDRRVINRKQTIGYMLFDGSRDFNIDGHKELFVDSILKISLPLQSKYNIIAGAWDVIDDLLVGGIIEKTRTRWGKFVPYIFLGGIPLAIISTVYWLLPIIFSPEHINNFEYLPKFVAFAALDMLFELFSNFKNVAIGGYISTITPYPSDRRRLLAISSYFSIIYSRIPDLIIEFMLDFIKNGIVKSATRSTADMIKASMLFVGPFTAIVSGIIISWYCKMAKERVHQRIETAKVWQSLKTVVTNRPILMYMLSNALGSFGTGLTIPSGTEYDNI